MNIYNFLDSNFFQTLVVFVTGLVAYFIYVLTKRNEKRDSARIIINEIQLAERAIQDIRNNRRITELSIILPTDTWKGKKHLFLNDFDQDELNLINDFYYKCSYAEEYRQLYFKILNNSVITKASYLQEKLVDLMFLTIEKHKGSQEFYETNKRSLIEFADKEEWLFNPGRPITNLLDYINNIHMLTPTNLGQTLKRIAR